MASWDKTQYMEQRLEDKLEGGVYRGRKVICRDSPIDGGVYIGAGEREAIVVDSKKYNEIKKLYKKAREKALVGVVTKDVAKGLVLNAVYNTVKEAMKYDKDAVNGLINICNSGTDGKIALDVFIKNKVGVCRHMALACGALLELFRKDGYIRGKASIDRNTINGGHAWCRYTNSGGEVFILDVAQDYIGRLEKAENWNYRRPDEQKND
ncbi:MAG: hypothetical protein PHO02_01575 [Candidatus Nanoarchaeia archaeon]|nr:hypothetical protein [Candidatus Nanoarchaeia archaeon]